MISSLYFLMIVAVVAGLSVLLLWSLRRPTPARFKAERLDTLEIPGGHVVYLEQMRQALQKEDLAFLTSRGSADLAREVKRERTRVLLRYLEAMHGDFDQLIRLARVIAVLSPEIAPAQEWERLRLAVWFSLNYFLLRARLHLGLAAMPQLNGIGQRLGDLAMRIEKAMTELGERAALANELASTLQA